MGYFKRTQFVFLFTLVFANGAYAQNTSHKQTSDKTSSQADKSDSTDVRRLGLVIGALVGMESIAEGSTASGLGYGLAVAYSISPLFRAGLNFSTTDSSPAPAAGAPAGTPATKITRLSLLMANAEFQLPFQKIKGIFINGKVGMGIRAATYGAPSPGGYTDSYFAIGGGAGYNYSIFGNMSVGPQINYNMVFAPVSIGDTQIQLAVRYWL